MPNKSIESSQCYDFNQRKSPFSYFFFSFSSRKITDKKSKDSIAGDYPESCSICHKNRAAGASVGSQSAANGPLLLTSCGNCSASICTSPACAIRSANSDCWECNECHRQRLDTATGYLQAYDWIFERLNRKFSERASSAISSNKSEAERRRCCSNVMWSSNGKSICLVCFVVVAGRLIAPMLMAPRALRHNRFIWISIAGEPVIVSPPLQERIRVREFIEDLISSMLGGSLDDVCVGQIYENIDCEYSDGVAYLQGVLFSIDIELIRLGARSSSLFFLPPNITWIFRLKIIRTIP